MLPVGCDGCVSGAAGCVSGAAGCVSGAAGDVKALQVAGGHAVADEMKLKGFHENTSYRLGISPPGKLRTGAEFLL